MSKIWTHQYSSGQTHADFEFPADEDLCAWFAPSTSGTVVIKNEDGTTLTYVAVGGEVIKGRFTSLTSNSCTKLTCGNGDSPLPALATAGTSSVASSDTRISTEESVQISADTSVISRLSLADSVVTSAATSLTTSAVTRLSTADSVLTSTTVSLQSRLSVAESVEASKG